MEMRSRSFIDNTKREMRVRSWSSSDINDPEKVRLLMNAAAVKSSSSNNNDGDSYSKPTANSPAYEEFRRKWLSPIIELTFTLVIYFYYFHGRDNTDNETNGAGLPSYGYGMIKWKPLPGRTYPPLTMVAELGEAATDAPVSFDERVQMFQDAKNEMIRQLKVDYGESHFESMFNDNGQSPAGREAFSSALGESRTRLKRKMMLKLLRIQQSEDDKINKNEQEDGGADGITETFIWATGGHSTAAGHGNLYDESYTAVMQRTAKAVFAAVGLDLVGRNYAMGGSSSAPEIAWCSEEIFGVDIDVLSWDYGMTDGGNDKMLEMYCRRAGLNPNRPACVGLGMGGGAYNSRTIKLKRLEESGMATLHAIPDYMKGVKSRVPDTLGLSNDEVKHMPPFLRYFRCGSQLETGAGCADHKYNDTICSDRKNKAMWHPGWKWHAMVGNIIALYIVELLGDAAKTIKTSKLSRTRLQEELQKQDDMDYHRFLQGEVPFMYSTLTVDQEQDLDVSIISKSPNFCHTARLPAEIRHKGILTESSDVGFFTYDMGISRSVADSPDYENFLRSMALTFDDDSRQECPVTLNMDFKDYFYVHGRTREWKKMTIPNDSEVREYGRGQVLRGLVAICLVICDWNKCPEGNLLAKDIVDGRADIEIDGIRVTNVTNLNIDTCHFLKSDSGHYFKANSNGRFEVKVRVNEPTSYIRFSSIIVW